eukprot:13247852-Alexandrium_andersonii.AAC.1
MSEGRVQCVMVDLGWPFPVRVVNLYGWTDAERDQSARQASEGLAKAIERELAASPEIPTLILGDFNIEARKLAFFREAMQAGDFID